MKAAIFFRKVLTFVFVYNVELIVLWAFQASPICVLSLSCLCLYVTGFSVVMQQAITDPSLLHSYCFQYFNSTPRPHPPFNLTKM